MAIDDDEVQAGKIGRPAGKRGKFSFRVTADLREKLEQISAKNGRPVSEEIEMRLEESFTVDNIISKAIDSSIKGGADAAVKALKNMVGGEHFFMVGMNLAVWYRHGVEETATSDNKMAWVSDETKFGIVKEVLNRGVSEWLDTIRRSSVLMEDPNMDKVTELLFNAVATEANRASSANGAAREHKRVQRMPRKKPRV